MLIFLSKYTTLLFLVSESRDFWESFWTCLCWQLTWRQHINYIISDAYRRVNLKKALSSTSWGASSRILRLFYGAYIRSKLEYASVIFIGVAALLKNKLKVIQNVCLRMILGARNTIPIRSMEVEADIAPLDSRQESRLSSGKTLL